MKSNDASELVNFFPRTGDVVSRPGYVQHCDAGTGAPIARMMEFEFGAYHRLIAASAGLILDVTSTSPLVLGGGFSSDYWSSDTLSGRLLMANGVDLMQQFDGATLSPAGFTGISTDQLSHVHVHQGRVFAVQRGSQAFWYGSPNTIAGALNQFDMSLVGAYGGDLLMTLTLTRDGGSGPDDYLVLIFTSGDAAVYSGTNPSDPENWAIVGHFKMGRPLGRFSALEYGDNIILLTERGYESVKVALPLGLTATTGKMLSFKIEKAVNAAIARSRGNDAWHALSYPSNNMLIVNVPTVDDKTTEQHVQNMSTGSWCRFTGLNATSWCSFGSSVYIGSIDGKVNWFGGTNNDNGARIPVTALTAWDYLDNRVKKKHHKLQKVLFESEIMPEIRIAIGVDFAPVSTGRPVTLQRNTDATYWDDAFWDENYFGPDSQAKQGWVKNNAIGVASSCRVTAFVSEAALAWNGITYIFEPGGLI